MRQILPRTIIFLLVLLIPCAYGQSPVLIHEGLGYVKPETCYGCHRSVWETYRRTGMGRSFARLSSAAIGQDLATKTPFYHQASDSYFAMIQRDGKVYQRRYQIDSGGNQVNLMEKQVDFVIGSGNHARTYLSRTERGKLLELPLGWYAEKGGYWAMNPGYDRPNHDGFRRPIAYDCMFCHNGYPKILAGHDQPFAEPLYAGSLPEGIDCQRCHGPGGKHAQLAGSAGANLADIRNAIVNPSRLNLQRQMELCMSCHLETTSFPLPNALQRYERGPFSYQPGEPLEKFILNFDHAAGTGRENKFEIVSAAYRLRKSACYLNGGDKLLCTTCHNPHDIPRGEEAARHYTAICRQCHASTFNQLVDAGKHSRSADCVGCHMPKRRTEDAVHVVVTDHYIQRHQQVGNLLADIPERHETGSGTYRGPVALYYPNQLPDTPGNELLRAVAQVNQGSNLKQGIAQLSAAIERHLPGRAEYYFELAEAWRSNGDLARAMPLYRKAVERNPDFRPGVQKLGFALRASGKYAEAAEALRRAASIAPDNASTWLELGLTYRASGKEQEAMAAFRKAAELDPDMPEAHNNLGILSYSSGESGRAESEFREALRIQPDNADSHGNLASLLSAKGSLTDALTHFEIALRLRGDDAATRYNYAVALGRSQKFDEAQRELELAVAAEPRLVDAQELLGDLLMAKRQPQNALPHYQAAVRQRPDSGRAQLGLGSALAATGDLTGAIAPLRLAAVDSDARIREEALQKIRQIEKP